MVINLPSKCSIKVSPYFFFLLHSLGSIHLAQWFVLSCVIDIQDVVKHPKVTH